MTYRFFSVPNQRNEIWLPISSSTSRFSFSFAGTGESFLFKVVDERVAGGGGGGGGGGVDDVVVRVSPWNRGPDGNQHFFQGKPGCLVVGASQGRFGLWVDGNLDHGRLDRCLTFEKWPPPAPALQPKDFKVKCLECYNFV